MSAEHENIFKEAGWRIDRAGEINMQKVIFFRHPDHPKRVLKYYPNAGGFMVSHDSGVNTVYLGKTHCYIQFHTVDKFADAIKALN